VARLSRGFPQRGPRRKTSWEIGSQSGVDGAPRTIAGSAIQVGTTGVSSLSDGLTLIRTRGEVNMLLTSIDALGNGFHGAFGLGIVNENAFSAGVGSMLSALTDEDWDGWFFHRYFSLIAGGPIAAATAAQEALQNSATSTALRLEVDSKAMRKLGEQEVIYASMEVVLVGGAGSMEWAFNSRSLFKLP